MGDLAHLSPSPRLAGTPYFDVSPTSILTFSRRRADPSGSFLPASLFPSMSPVSCLPFLIDPHLLYCPFSPLYPCFNVVLTSLWYFGETDVAPPSFLSSYTLYVFPASGALRPTFRRRCGFPKTYSPPIG